METNIQFDVWGASHTGMVRSLNEDRFSLQTPSGVWVVADGMGGHDGGDIASGCVVEQTESIGIASSAPDLQARVAHRFHRANDMIQQISQERGGAVIGSTVVSLLAYGNQYACLWCGDSRLYLRRGGTFAQVSSDHSEVQELLNDGTITAEEARTWPRKNVITRAIGVAEDPRIEQVSGTLQVGDCFVLCSDGLTEHLSDEEINEHVAGRRPKEACERLIDTTLERGASDNVTVVVVQCRNADATIPMAWDEA